MLKAELRHADEAIRDERRAIADEKKGWKNSNGKGIPPKLRCERSGSWSELWTSSGITAGYFLSGLASTRRGIVERDKAVPWQPSRLTQPRRRATANLCASEHK